MCKYSFCGLTMMYADSVMFWHTLLLPCSGGMKPEDVGVCSMVSSNGQVPHSSAKQVKPNFISLCIFTVEIERVSDNSDGVRDK